MSPHTAHLLSQSADWKWAWLSSLCSKFQSTGKSITTPQSTMITFCQNTYGNNLKWFDRWLVWLSFCPLVLRDKIRLKMITISHDEQFDFSLSHLTLDWMARVLTTTLTESTQMKMGITQMQTQIIWIEEIMEIPWITSAHLTTWREILFFGRN